MNTSANPFLLPLNELFIRLNTLNWLLFYLENSLNSFRKLFKEIIDESNTDLPHIGAGTSLVIRDLSEWPEDGWSRCYPTGRFVLWGEAYLKEVDTLVHRECAWTISQAYEAFETFLKDITAHYLREHRDQADAKKLKKQENELKKLSLEPTDIEYWKKFVRLAYGKNEDLLNFLGKIAPDLEEVELRNNRAIDLTKWHPVAAEVRHAATHSNMLIKSNRMDKWSQKGYDLTLASFFSGTYADGGYRLELCSKDAESNLKLFAEYAFAIFKSLSKLDGYRWNILLGMTNKDIA